MHVRKVLGSPTLQTVVRWSICRDLSCLRDKRSSAVGASPPRHPRRARRHPNSHPNSLARDKLLGSDSTVKEWRRMGKKYHSYNFFYLYFIEIAGRAADPHRPHPCKQEPAISPVAVQPRNNVMRYTPMRCTPVRYTPMRYTPMRCR